MRGYETIEKLKSWLKRHSYESPCGVMSMHSGLSHSARKMLRIPMRGYEIRIGLYAIITKRVTNPHAGL